MFTKTRCHYLAALYLTSACRWVLFYPNQWFLNFVNWISFIQLCIGSNFAVFLLLPIFLHLAALLTDYKPAWSLKAFKFVTGLTACGHKRNNLDINTLNSLACSPHVLTKLLQFPRKIHTFPPNTSRSPQELSHMWSWINQFASLTVATVLGFHRARMYPPSPATIHYICW